MNLTIVFLGRPIIRMFVPGTIYIFIVKEMFAKGVIIEIIIEIIVVIKRKILRKIIAIIKIMSH
jgi:hypothetical protein